MTRKAEAQAPFQPLIVHERGEIVGALIERRHALGWTGEDLDERAGWADRLTGKMETPRRPAGKLGFHFSFPTEVTPTGSIRCSGMADVWCAVLGVRLVLVDEATAKAIGAKPAPPPIPRPTPFGNTGPAHAARRIELGKRSTMTIHAHEAADRTQVVALSFKVAVTDHAWLSQRPALKAKAEAIEAELQALASEIREAA